MPLWAAQDITAFMEAWGDRCPVVIVPTKCRAGALPPPSPLPPSCEMAQPLAHAQPSASSAKVTAGPASWP
eukprot:SAG25_NODE_944_length_4650_cov_9.607119_4_plen_71_part_00